MDTPAEKRINKAYRNAAEITVGDLSRIFIISDCHRGDGGNADDFSKNENIYLTALYRYYCDGFTCVELGDGDELWKNNNFHGIVEAHRDVFALLSGFHRENRLYMVFGNHDIVKKSRRWVKDNMSVYYDARKKQQIPLFPGINIHESIVLKHGKTGGRMLLLHEHQADFFNCELHPLARLLVRYLWRPLESLGVNDPTSASRNDGRKNIVEDTLSHWAEKSKAALMAGHTHRGMFPAPGGAAYFNDGCCVHPGMVTAVEIQLGMIYFVRWRVKARSDGVLFVAREILEGPTPLDTYLLHNT